MASAGDVLGTVCRKWVQGRSKIMKVMRTDFFFFLPVTVVENGTIALQYLGFDGEQELIGYEIRVFNC